MTSGSLKDLIQGDYNGPLIRDQTILFRQITSGLAHLHEKKIVHRYLKPSNILISCPDGSQVHPVLKLANFGIARNGKTGGCFPLWKIAGSKSWLGPEIYQAVAFTVEFDLFSLGLVFGYSLSKGKHPYGGPSKEDRIIRIQSKQPMVLSARDFEAVGSASAEDMLTLISSLLSVNPSERPPASSLLNHASLCQEIPTTSQSPELTHQSIIILHLFYSFN